MTTNQFNILSKELTLIQNPVLEENHIQRKLMLHLKQFARPMRLRYIFHNKESEQHRFHAKSGWEPPAQRSVVLETY